MGRRAALGILAVFLLAGCSSDAPPDLPSGPTATAAPAPPPSYGPAACGNLLLFQIVDHGEADRFLPPGFHARDPQAFLNSPAAIGQAGVVFMALDCQSEASGPLTAAFVGIFIEAPIVEGLEPAPLNFLELVRYNPAGEFGGALASSGWPVVPANISLVSEVPGLQGFDSMAVVEDGEGTVARVAGTVATTDGSLGSPARFWHQGAGGLGFIEYNGSLVPSVGTGVCEARPGTPLGAFVGAPVGVQTPIGDPTSCLGVNESEPVVVVLQDLVLDATFHWFPGERAG